MAKRKALAERVHWTIDTHTGALHVTLAGMCGTMVKMPNGKWYIVAANGGHEFAAKTIREAKAKAVPIVQSAVLASAEEWRDET